MMLQVESMVAKPGEKSVGYIHIDLGLADVRLPIVLINGSQPGPRLTFTAGIHHGEFIGIEALREVIRSVKAFQLSGQIVACPLSNPPSFYARRGNQSPFDEINPNRVFPGSPTGKPTERLAYWLFQNLVAGSDAYIDLHGGGLTEGMAPFVAYRSSGDDMLDKQTVALAEAFGWVDVIRGTSAGGGNTHAAATRVGIPSLLVEIGSEGSRSREEVRMVVDGLMRVLAHMGMMAIDIPGEMVHQRHWRWAEEVEAPGEGLWYPNHQVGDELPEGALLGRILDPLDRELAVVYTPVAGKVFYSERGLVAACGEVLAAIAVREES